MIREAGPARNSANNRRSSTLAPRGMNDDRSVRTERFGISHPAAARLAASQAVPTIRALFTAGMKRHNATVPVIFAHLDLGDVLVSPPDY